MNLREQLRHLLTELLPHDPEEAIKGTELIRLVRLRLGDDYSDATLRYHFSILSYDSSSPIAKVDQGQGYYLRQKRLSPVTATEVTGGSDLLFPVPGAEPGVDLMQLRFQRLIALDERLSRQRSQHVFQLNGRPGTLAEVKGLWDLPDLVRAEWDLDSGSEEPQPRLDRAMLALRRHLGAPETMLTGVQFKLSLSAETLAAEFFRALSATHWTLRSEIVIAEPLNDEALVDELRRLGHSFGIGISTLGIHATQLDELPTARDLRSISPDQFERVQEKLRPQRLTLATTRPSLDWQTFSTLRKKYDCVAELIRWLEQCLGTSNS
jgi:hypothetical protein